jgi:energy-converting hydrogenase A subunit M
MAEVMYVECLFQLPGYTDAAIHQCVEALAQKVVVLCDLKEFYFALEQERDLAEILREKVKSAILDKAPYVKAE